jgi:hypothetical protein
LAPHYRITQDIIPDPPAPQQSSTTARPNPNPITPIPDDITQHTTAKEEIVEERKTATPSSVPSLNRISSSTRVQRYMVSKLSKTASGQNLLSSALGQSSKAILEIFLSCAQKCMFKYPPPPPPHSVQIVFLPCISSTCLSNFLSFSVSLSLSLSLYIYI